MKHLIVAAFFFVVGCDSAEMQQPTGGLKGKVGLYDIHGTILADASGVSVKVEGTSFSTVSDTGGNWSFVGLPISTYTVSFSKEGYGMEKEPFTVYEDSTTAGPAITYLHQPLPYTVVLDSITPPEISPRKFGRLSGHFVGASPQDRPRLIARVIIGLSPEMDIDDTTTYIGSMYFGAIFLNTKDSVITFEETGFGWENYGHGDYHEASWLESGKKIYLQAYPWYQNYSLSYFDIATLKWVTSVPYTASPVYSVTIP